MATYAHHNYFATFGNGFDLYGGLYNIGHQGYRGYVNSSNYDQSKGTIDVGDNNNYTRSGAFRIMALETYTFSTAAVSPDESGGATSVPEPTSIAMLGLGGLFLLLNRKKLKNK